METNDELLDDAILSAKNELNLNPRSADAWYNLFLAENKGFQEPLDSISDEMAYNRARELADSKMKERMEREYVICKYLKTIPIYPFFFLAISNENETMVYESLKKLAEEDRHYDLTLDSEFTSTAFKILAVEKKSIYNVFFYLVSKATEGSSFAAEFRRRNTGFSFTDDETVKEVTSYYANKHDLSLLEEELRKNNEEVLALTEEISSMEEKIKEDTTHKETLMTTIDELNAKIDELIKETEIHPFNGNLRPGNRVDFGTYRDEPISWIVLAKEDDHALLLSEKILGATYLDKNYNNYERADLRMWLNDEFYVNCFTDREKIAIIKAYTDNSVLSVGEDNPFLAANTRDYAFLLSVSDVLKYIPSETDRIAEATDMAVHDGLYIQTNYSSGEKKNTGMWWLRSPSIEGRSSMKTIDFSGLVHTNYVNDVKIGIRPAIWIKL